MGDKSKIEWTDATWNPIRGCSLVSAGCENCYAMKMAHRFSGPGKPFDGLTRLGKHGPVWTGDVRLVPEVLDQPLRWRKPRQIFVNSMSDLFHKDVPNEYIAAVFGVMAAAPQHTFQVLTKRPDRMSEWSEWVGASSECRSDASDRVVTDMFGVPELNNYLTRYDRETDEGGSEGFYDHLIEEPPEWPLPNVWLGVSVENQEAADKRMPLLLQTPAAVRFVSAEPLLGPVDLSRWVWGNRCPDRQCSDSTWDHACQLGEQRLHWVIVGGESGPGARPMHPDWARSIRDQCVAAGVPFHFKQWGAHVRPDQAPPDTWHGPDGQGDGYSDQMFRVGKKRAGRELDGRTWDQFPEGM